MTRCALVLLVTLILANAAGAGDSPETLLEEGYYLEVATADLEGAMRAYEGVLSSGGVPPRIAARARLRLGICQELLGRPHQPPVQFEAVSAAAGAEAAAIKIARRHLGQAVLDEPARFMPPDILFYAEVVDPSERIRELASLLKGTPFENPVDYYVTYLSRSAPEGGPPSAAPEAEPLEVRQAAAFLNEGFLRELQKVEGMALAVPGDRSSEGDFIAVLFPGKSDIIRGLIQMGLTISKAKPIGHARGIPIFEADEPPEKEGARSEQMCFALGREVILIGRPARLLEEAIERHASGSGSLADTDAFRDARPSRQGSVVFAVIGHERLLESMRESARDKPGLALAEAVLGTGSLSALSAAVSWMPASDSLRLAVRARFSPGLPESWSALATPPLGSAGIPPTPEGSPGLLALRLDRGSARWEALRKALDPIFEAAARDGKGELAMIHGLFAEGPGRKLIDDVDGLALGFAEAPAPGEKNDRLFASLRVRSPEGGQALVEETMADLLGKVFRTRASRAFEDVEVPAAPGGAPLRARSVEPVPGIRIYLASIAGSVVISPTLEILSGMRAGGPPDFTIPAGAGKAVFLRPAAWLAAYPEDGSHRDILRDVSRAIITLREDRDAVHADIHVPAFTEVARAILRRLANAQRLEALEKGEAPRDPAAPPRSRDPHLRRPRRGSRARREAGHRVRRGIGTRVRPRAGAALRCAPSPVRAPHR